MTDTLTEKDIVLGLCQGNYKTREEIFSSPLMWCAIKNEDIRAVELLKEYANFQTATNNQNEIVFDEQFLYACRVVNNPDFLKILFNLMKNLFSKESIVPILNNAIQAASVSNKHPEIIKALAELGADVNYKTLLMQTPLIFSVMWNNNPEVVKALLEAGAKTNVKDYHGKNALKYAQEHQNKEVINLLKQYGAK